VQTPGHAVVNLAILGAVVSPEYAPYFVAGAIAPDVPLFALWLTQRLRGQVHEKWLRIDLERPWIDIIHATHSILLSGIGFALSVVFGAWPLAAFFGSMMLHQVVDFPMHAEDAHRHFFPLSNWRWIAPFSYWDERYHARAVGLVEWAGVVAASVWMWKSASPVLKFFCVAILGFYALSYYKMFLRRHDDVEDEEPREA
jgi:uncharacterized membrane protein